MIQTNQVLSNDDHGSPGSTKIVNFMTPRAGVLVPGRGHVSHIEKMHYFFKLLRMVQINAKRPF